MPSQSSKVNTTANGSIKGTEVSRPQQKKPIIWIFSFALLIIIVVAFVVAPIYSPMVKNSIYFSFGKYQGQEIAYKDGNFFASQYENYTKSQEKGSKEASIKKDALRYAFDQTVIHLSLLKLESDLGVSVSDEKVISVLQNPNNASPLIAQLAPQFYENGKFSLAKLEKTSMSDINTIREQIIHDQVASDLIEGPLESTQETNFIVNMGRWTRSFEYVSFTSSDYPDSEVIAYAQKNPKLFRSIDLSSITVANKANATTYRQQILDKKISFEDIAKAHSIDSFKDKAGLRGASIYNELVLELTEKEAADKVLALKNGEISPVLAVAGGFVFFKANSDAVDANTSDLGTLTLIRNYLTSYEKGTVDDYLVSAAKDFNAKAKASSIEKVAKSLGKKILETTAFPINQSGLVFIYGNRPFPLMTYPSTSDNQPISDALDNENFFITAFKLKEKELSEPVILRDMVLVMEVKTDKQANDTELDMLIKVTPQLLKQYLSNDLQGILVQNDKLVDNFDKAYRAHFSAE